MEFETKESVGSGAGSQPSPPRVNLNPVHTDLTSGMSMSSRLGEEDSRRTFEFEMESTNQETTAATEPAKVASHPHHRTALLVSVLVAVIFAALAAVAYYFVHQ